MFFSWAWYRCFPFINSYYPSVIYYSAVVVLSLVLMGVLLWNPHNRPMRSGPLPCLTAVSGRTSLLAQVVWLIVPAHPASCAPLTPPEAHLVLLRLPALPIPWWPLLPGNMAKPLVPSPCSRVRHGLILNVSGHDVSKLSKTSQRTFHALSVPSPRVRHRGPRGELWGHRRWRNHSLTWPESNCQRWTSVFSRNNLSRLKSLRFRSYSSSSFLLLRLPLFSWKSSLSSCIGYLSKPMEWFLALPIEPMLQNSWWRASWAGSLWGPVYSGRLRRLVSPERYKLHLLVGQAELGHLMPQERSWCSGLLLFLSVRPMRHPWVLSVHRLRDFSGKFHTFLTVLSIFPNIQGPDTQLQIIASFLWHFNHSVTASTSRLFRGLRREGNGDSDFWCSVNRRMLAKLQKKRAIFSHTHQSP